MEVFRNVTAAGNERAVRKGKQVPDGDVNLAYFKAPDLTPKENIVIVDTSRIIQENDLPPSSTRKLYYANMVGVLEDANGNQLVADQYPAVTDEFDVPEDFLAHPGSLYTPEDMLPFIHVSRFFHLDFSGQTLGADLIPFTSSRIKVVDSAGRHYANPDGTPRYKIKIIAAAFARPAPQYEQSPYRVHIFIDTDEREDLFLTYNKVEIDHTGTLRNFAVSWRERINAKPYFHYQPEEAAVFDPENRQEKWYSSKPLTLKEQILDLPKPSVDGYKVYVPKKAVPDPRVFQLFRWRLKCDFNQPYQVDPTRQFRTINCGVVVTSADLLLPKPSRATYAFYNLGHSGYNATGVGFTNPLHQNDTTLNPDQAAYWYVNMDTVSTDELAQFDILLWAPYGTVKYDLSRYQAKIDYFTTNLGGTLFIDTDDASYITGLGTVSDALTAAVTPWAGTVRSPGPTPSAHPFAPTQTSGLNSTHPLIDGQTQLSGWELINNAATPGSAPLITANLNALKRQLSSNVSLNVNAAQHVATTPGSPAGSLSYVQLNNPAYCQYLTSAPPGWNWVIVNGQDGGFHYFVLERTTPGGGHVIFSTLAILFTCSALLSFDTRGGVTNENTGPTRLADPNYNLYINTSLIEGAMKFLFNACLLAAKGKIISRDNPTAYSTSWSFATDWQTSWAINAGGGVLSDEEINKYQFTFGPEDALTPTPVWQRKLSDKTLRQLIDEALDAEVASVVQGATREYTLEVTNSMVSVPQVLGDNSFPYAWTTAYSPALQVPVELGPHIVKEEEIKGKYEAGQYIHRSYPSKPYSGQLQVSYLTTTDDFIPQEVTWVATGTALQTTIITSTTPPTTSTGSSEVTLNWVGSGRNKLFIGGENPYKGAPRPDGLYTLQEAEYHADLYGNVQNNWMHYGVFGQWDTGSSGEAVAFCQWALNRIQFWRPYLLSGPGLVTDGVYGRTTHAKVLQFQQNLQARFLDGIVDAETLSLIGGQLVALGNVTLNGVNLGLQGTSEGDYTRFARYAIISYGQLQGMSDGNSYTAWMKRSWVRRGPNFIWDIFYVGLNQDYDIHGLTIIPYLQGATQTMLLRAVDVRRGYNSVVYPEQMTLPNLGFRMAHRAPFYLPFGPYRGGAFAVCVGQDGPAVAGSRCFGIEDIWAHARVQTSTVIPGSTKITKQTRTIPISATGVAKISTNNSVSFYPHMTLTETQARQQLSPLPRPQVNLSNIQWTGVTTNSHSVRATIRADGLITLQSDTVSHAIGGADPTTYTQGPTLPAPDGSLVFYSCDEHKKVNPVPETGWISKIDGIKLLCKRDGTPFGFANATGQSIFPTGVGTKDTQRHYLKITLMPLGVDATVVFGFYDIGRQEFIRDAAGRSEMSYEEYIARGPNNVYIGVLSSYELDTVSPLPPTDNSQALPYRLAMPIYGVLARSQPRITLEPVPDNLTYGDIWPVAVKSGYFDRKLRLRPPSQGHLTGYLNRYQGAVVHAFYSVPEAADAGWSTIFGPPNVDVKDEEPILADDNLIQVREPPILLHRIPTVVNSLADPVRPQFTVFRSDNPTNTWHQLTLKDIADYNTRTGEIWLKQPMTTTDPSKLRVDYVSVRPNYYFKGFGTDLLNLNPYPGQSRNFIGKAIHIYIVPTLVKDEHDEVIRESIQSRAIRFTIDTDIFDPLSPRYDPLVIQLGVVYISPALDINQLSILDTRRRGGGALNTMATSEVVRLVQEASTYWDISFGTGLSYQKGGFVIVRLPTQLKQYFTEEQIMEVIDRNITAGVRYKIEDLSGNAWS